MCGVVGTQAAWGLCWPGEALVWSRGPWSEVQRTQLQRTRDGEAGLQGSGVGHGFLQGSFKRERGISEEIMGWHGMDRPPTLTYVEEPRLRKGLGPRRALGRLLPASHGLTSPRVLTVIFSVFPLICRFSRVRAEGACRFGVWGEPASWFPDGPRWCARLAGGPP